jgi:hypothetical protein
MRTRTGWDRDSHISQKESRFPDATDRHGMITRAPSTPPVAYFSNPELRALFAREFLVLVLRRQGLLTSAGETYERVRSEFGSVLGLRAVQDLPSPQDLNLSQIPMLRIKNHDHWVSFSKISDIPLRMCELCDRRLQAVQNAHILSRRFFRSLAFKRRPTWRMYETSPVNILRLCGHCHDVIDKPSLSAPRVQLSRMIARRRRANRRLASFCREKRKRLYSCGVVRGYGAPV